MSKKLYYDAELDMHFRDDAKIMAEVWKKAKSDWEKENPGKKGMKFSKDKPKWQFMAPLWPFMEEVVTVLTRGAEKYEENNWMYVDRSEYLRAIMSHYSAYASGSLVDEDMATSHLANLICSALFLMWHDQEAVRAEKILMEDSDEK